MAICDAEGGDTAEAMRKLIARVAIAASVDRRIVINMPLDEFVQAALKLTTPLRNSKQILPEEKDCQMKDELPTRIWSVQEYYQAKEFYEKRGAIFNPALERGSPAAAHVIAQLQLKEQRQSTDRETAPRAVETTVGLTNNVDVGIITIREDEFLAVLNRLPSRKALEYPKQIYQYARASIPDGRDIGVAVARTIGPGHAAANSLTRDMIDELNPKWLLVVGIAGGIPADEFRGVNTTRM